MEIIPGLTLDLSLIVGVMVKVAMLLIFVLSLVMVRQESLMHRVVNFPVGGSLKILTWSFCVISFLFTVIVILV